MSNNNVIMNLSIIQTFRCMYFEKKKKNVLAIQGILCGVISDLGMESQNYFRPNLWA